MKRPGGIVPAPVIKSQGPVPRFLKLENRSAGKGMRRTAGNIDDQRVLGKTEPARLLRKHGFSVDEDGHTVVLPADLDPVVEGHDFRARRVRPAALESLTVSLKAEGLGGRRGGLGLVSGFEHGERVVLDVLDGAEAQDDIRNHGRVSARLEPGDIDRNDPAFVLGIRFGARMKLKRKGLSGIKDLEKLAQTGPARTEQAFSRDLGESGRSMEVRPRQTRPGFFGCAPNHSSAILSGSPGSDGSRPRKRRIRDSAGGLPQA
jgi:hypothetical protein